MELGFNSLNEHIKKSFLVFYHIKCQKMHKNNKARDGNTADHKGWDFYLMSAV